MAWPTDPEQRGQRSLTTGAHLARGARAVVGFDATTASQNALAYAIGWARRIGGGLAVLHVLEDDWRWTLDVCAVTPATVTMPSWDDDLSGIVVDALAGTGLAWTYHTARGSVAHALEQHAERIDADLIIVGRPGHHPPRPTWTTVAYRLLSRTRRIIIVVP